ncbi:hypothetical protein PG989_011720 [Apiospora arundinis]|uniref:Uncharacterized protein n=1 Tax=Apiospora arundinis TaxID=335852 RepID=A0ABR2HTL1_9PEZI
MPSYNTSSRSSSGSQTFRSPESSTYTKNVSYSSKGPVIVNHHAAGYDRHEPHPTYSTTNGGSRISSGSSSSSSRRH